jgi:hypothetical protein
MSDETEAVYQPDDLERLLALTEKRGYRRSTAITLFVIGCIPGLLVAMATQGRNGTLPLIGAALVIGPTLVLLLWTLRNRDGQDARELGMWVRIVRRTGELGVGARIRRQLPPVPPPHEIDRISLGDTADEYREVLTPMLASAGGLNMRIAVYRYWYVIGAMIVTAIGAVALVVLSPNFS